MQVTFEDVHNKLIDKLKKNIYYSDIDELIKEFQIVTYADTHTMDNDNNLDNDIVNIELLNETQLLSTEGNIKNKNDIIVFNIDQYLDKIAKSFKYNSDRIDCQFDMDIIRSELYFNSKRVTNRKDLVNKLIKIKDFRVSVLNNTFTIDKIIIMLCNQAALAFSFLLMCKIYNNVEAGIFVTSNRNEYHITYDNCNINIKLDVTFDIKNINNGDNNKNKISEVNIVTNIDAILKNNKYEFCKLGIISWNFLDNH